MHRQPLCKLQDHWHSSLAWPLDVSFSVPVGNVAQIDRKAAAGKEGAAAVPQPMLLGAALHFTVIRL